MNQSGRPKLELVRLRTTEKTMSDLGLVKGEGKEFHKKGPEKVRLVWLKILKSVEMVKIFDLV